MPADRKRRLATWFVAVAVLIAAPLAVVASDAFEDVPDSNVHHDDITWLADNNVTAGCNPPDNTEFCPGDPVLRQQMASFMRRLAENEVVNAATANEADHATSADSADSSEDSEKLDGQEATAYQTVVSAAACSVNDTATATSCAPGGTLPNQETVEMLTVEITAPVAGTLLLDAYTFTNATSWVSLDQSCAAYNPSNFTAIYSQLVNGLILGTDGNFPSSGNTATQVSAGAHTVRLCTAYEATDDGGSILNASLSAQWTAGGSLDIQTDGSGGEEPLDLPLLDS